MYSRQCDVARKAGGTPFKVFPEPVVNVKERKSGHPLTKPHHADIMGICPEWRPLRSPTGWRPAIIVLFQ